MDVKERPNRLPLPPILLVACCVGAYLLHVFLPIGWEPEKVTPLMTNGGWLLAVMALALDVWTFLTLRRHNTTILPNKAASQLAVDGPFRYSRNPIYLGNVLLCLGIGFILGSRWFLLMAVVLYVLLQKLAIEREEHHLSANFPEEWSDYSKRVRRWI